MVDVDQTDLFVQGDLGHTDLQEDLEFHRSSKCYLGSQVNGAYRCIRRVTDKFDRL